MKIDSGRSQSIGSGIVMIKLNPQAGTDIVEPVMGQPQTSP